MSSDKPALNPVGKVEGPTTGEYGKPYKHFVRLREPRDDEVGKYLYALPEPSISAVDPTKVLPVWWAEYYSGRSRGCSTYGSGVVVANTESEALGVCLSACPDTSACGWKITPIDTTRVGAHDELTTHEDCC